VNLLEMQELEIIINAEGNIGVRVKGSKGDRCLEMTKDLEESLGLLEEREFSSEYYESPVTVHQEGIVPVKR
jgi:Protein of unknown function (DUF2997)